jgi:hypothetical protein
MTPMTQYNIEHLGARREELSKGLETLRADLVKIDEMRTTTIGQIQQLLGAIQILNELIGTDNAAPPTPETVES